MHANHEHAIDMRPMKNPDIQATFNATLAMVARKIRTLFDLRAQEIGLTLPRARLLMQLGKEDGPIQSDLAGLLDIEQPTLVRLLDGLERLGMVERRAVEGDRRARRVFLTENARAQAAAVLAFVEELRADVFAGIDPRDIEIAAGVLQRMSLNIGHAGSTKA